MRSIKNSKGFTTFLNSQESQLFERLEEFGPIQKFGLGEREQYLLDQMRQREMWAQKGSWRHQSSCCWYR